MTPKEKVKELISTYYDCSKRLYYEDAVICAKITVDEIIKEFEYNSKQDIKNGFWQEVKNELEKKIRHSILKTLIIYLLTLKNTRLILCVKERK